MVVFLIIGLTLLALAVVLGIRAFTFSRLRLAANVENIDAYGFSGRTESVLIDTPKGDSTVDDFVTRVGEFVARRISGLDSADVRRELVGAGLYSVTPRKFAGYRAIAAVAVPALVLWALVGGGLP